MAQSGDKELGRIRCSDVGGTMAGESREVYEVYWKGIESKDGFADRRE